MPLQTQPSLGVDDVSLYDRPADTLEAQAQCAVPAALSIHRRGFYFGKGVQGGSAALHSEETTGAGADVTETGVQISRFSESVLDRDCDDGLSSWSRILWRQRRRKGKGCRGAPSRVELVEMPLQLPPQLPLVFVLHRQEWEIILFYFDLKGALNRKCVLSWSQ